MPIHYKDYIKLDKSTQTASLSWLEKNTEKLTHALKCKGTCGNTHNVFSQYLSKWVGAHSGEGLTHPIFVNIAKVFLGVCKGNHEEFEQRLNDLQTRLETVKGAKITDKKRKNEHQIDQSNTNNNKGPQKKGGFIKLNDWVIEAICGKDTLTNKDKGETLYCIQWVGKEEKTWGT